MDQDNTDDERRDYEEWEKTHGNDTMIQDANSDKAELELSEQLLLKNQDLKAYNENLKSELDLCKHNLNESRDLCRDQEEDIGNLRAIIRLLEKQLEYTKTINRYSKEIEDLDIKKSEIKDKLHF